MEQCICGNEQFDAVDKVCWTVSAEGKTAKAEDRKVQFGQCRRCGVIRQLRLPFASQKDHEAYYRDYPPTHKEYAAKDYEHDRILGVDRCDSYGITVGSGDRILDVGSGSGAFVDECRARGATTYGCEIAEYAYAKDRTFIYKGCFESLNFPTDHFDKVTCHDVLEHVLDPMVMLREMFRVTKQGGACIIDFPNFFSDCGEKHWKQNEHIWIFNVDQLCDLLSTVIGFSSVKVTHPIPSKLFFSCIKPGQDRPKILLPPGIGDSYWSLVKLQAFLAREKLALPDAYVFCNREKKYQGHKRSFPFLEMFPFLNSTGETFGSEGDPDQRRIWKEAYAREGRTIFSNILGGDYFIAYNGHLRVGKPLEAVDRDLSCNWHPPMFVSLKQEQFKETCKLRYGKYIVFYFIFQGTYAHWLDEFPMHQIAAFVRKLTDQTGFAPVFTGAVWDADETTLSDLIANIPNAVNLVGKTSVAQVFGLIRGAELLVGFPSGLSIMSAVMRQKTLIVWNDYYNRDFAWYCAPPDVRRETYFAVNTKTISAHTLSETAYAILEGQALDDKIIEPLPAEKQYSEYRDPIEESPPVSQRRRSRQAVAGPIGADDIAVACVLRSGGVFDAEYVRKLRDGLARNVTIPYRLYCLTDCDIDLDGCTNICLVHDYPGSWSKIELFRPNLIQASRIVYFDLDTIILRNIDDIVSAKFAMIGLKPWNARNRAKGMVASGLLSWKNDGTFARIYDNFRPEKIGEFLSGDQQYITQAAFNGNRKRLVMYQDIFHGIYSYKRNCREGKPRDARIVCFHGKLKPHSASVTDDWVKINWR